MPRQEPTKLAGEKNNENHFFLMYQKKHFSRVSVKKRLLSNFCKPFAHNFSVLQTPTYTSFIKNDKLQL